MDSEYLYALPGVVEDIAPLQELTDCDNTTCYAEDWNRPIINARMHSKTGNSGCGVWSGKGELIGHIGGVDGTSITYAQINPVTQGRIDNMIRRAKAW
jgi:hypothetical protein